MRYLVKKAILGPVPELEISAEKYKQLQSARTILSHAFSLEETYEIVITNYLALETSILSATAAHMIRESLSYSDFYAMRLELNVRLVNLLTATRLYLDQLAGNAQRCAPHLVEVEKIVN